jgi:hypothetical protein
MIRWEALGGRRFSMAKGSDRSAGNFETEDSGGALSGLLAEEDEFDRRALWRLGAWAAGATTAVIIAILANHSSLGMRRELTPSTDFIRQAQQIQLATKDNLSETKRLASAVETLNGDRDRLYSRVAVLEQGLDSVTGAVVRQNSASSSSPSSSSAAPPAVAPSASTSAASTAPAPVAAAPAAPAAAAAIEPPAAPKPAVASSLPVPVASPVAAAATSTAANEKPTPKSAGAEPGATQVAVLPQPASTQPAASLMAPKSMMAPPDPAATKLIEPATLPKVVTSAPIPEVTATVAKASEDEAGSEVPSAAPELAARRTEFGIDVGGANSIPGLRALWRGLLKSRSNGALTTLRPIIVIKENSNGLGMQLRLIAGPISDAAAAAKICATLTVSDRSCTTAVFEGQRLALNPEEQAKADAKTAPDKATSETAQASVDPKFAPKVSSPKHYAVKPPPPKEEAPKPEEPSTLSLIFGKH